MDWLKRTDWANDLRWYSANATLRHWRWDFPIGILNRTPIH
jgi:hypothetical protein